MYALSFLYLQSYWTEYVYLPHIRKQQKDAANAWLRTCFRYHPEKIVRSASKLIECSDTKGIFDQHFSSRWFIQFNLFTENIIRHLQSYDKPKSPPNMPQATNLIQNISYNELSTETIAPKLRKAFKNVVDYSR